MQSTFKTSFILLSALLAYSSNVPAASYQHKPQSCRVDGSAKIITSVGPVASSRLGQSYEQGEGVAQNNSQSYEWYCNAAMQKDSDAQLRIALLLLEGKGVERNVDKGLYWLNRAANNGNHDAELALGILLVDTEAIRSAVLFKRAAAGGNLYANHRLAELYYYGMGVPQNYRKAQDLSELGVAAGFDKSKELLTRIQIKQASGVFKSDEPVPSVESVAQIQQPPVEKEEAQKSNNVLQNFLAILPSLPNFNNDTSAEGDVSVITSEASSVAPPKVQELPSSVQQPIVNKPLSTSENAAVISTKQAVSSQKELEDQLVKAANDAVEQETTAATSKQAVRSTVAAQSQIVASTSVDTKQLTNTKAEQAVQKLGTNAIVKEEVSVTSNSASIKAPTLDVQPVVRGAKWVNAQADMRYAIQLVQASSLSGIVKFIKKHDLYENSYYIHALQDGQYRYILLYGNYPNNRTSMKIAKTLPEAVQKAGYWIRTFGDLRRSYKISP